MATAEFLTESDCEPILHMYDAMVAAAAAATVSVTPGPAAADGIGKAAVPQDDFAVVLNKLSGMFAFVLTDEKTDRFIAARDHMGIVPLYM